MSGKDKLISVEHLKWNVGGIKCGTLTVDYLNWILDHEEPAVDAEPVRHGKWIREVRYTIDSLHSYQQYRCSECGMTYITNTKRCPNCGARMDEERKEE